MKKTIKLIPLLVLTLVIFSSCDSESKYSLVTPEGIKQLTETINKEIDKNKEIHSISFYIDNFNSFSNNASSIILSIGSSKNAKKNGSILLPYEIEEIDIALDPEVKITSSKKTMHGKRNTAAIGDFDFSKITPYLDASLAFIPEEYEYRGIENYEITMNNEDYIEHNFTIQVTPKEGATQMSGKRIQTTYYELKFKTDKAGKLELIED